MPPIPIVRSPSLPAKRLRLLAGTLVGAGLLLVGLVSGLLLWRTGAPLASAASLAEISALPVPVEFPAPELKLSGLDQGVYSLAQFRGQVVLVNNWATWCPPCQAEMPTLEAYYQKYQSQGFVLIAIESGDSAENVQAFVRDYGLTFPVWLDPAGKALDAFRNNHLPSSYVIDRQGTVRLAWTGAINTAMLEKYVTPLLED